MKKTHFIEGAVTAFLMTSSHIIDAAVIGFALFAKFFGAGNFVVPLLIGFSAGKHWFIAGIGLALSGILIPLLSLTATSKMGGSFQDLCRPVGRDFHIIYLAVFIGLVSLCAVPRQAAVGVENGFLVAIPQLNLQWLNPLIHAVYFIIVYIAARKHNLVVDILGKIMAPLQITVFTILIIQIMHYPVTTPIDTGITHPLNYGFIHGSQTGDVAILVVIAATYTGSIWQKGYRRKEPIKRITRTATFFTFGAVIYIYTALLYLGASGSAILPQNVDPSKLLKTLVLCYTGEKEQYLMGLSVLLACITTSIGLTAAAASIANNLSDKKLPINYRHWLIIFCFISYMISIVGVHIIMEYTFWIFRSIYPVALVLIILGLLNRLVPNKGSWQGAILMAAFSGICDAAVQLSQEIGGIFMLNNFIHWYLSLPLSHYGFGWVFPVIFGFLSGTCVNFMTKSSR